MTHRRIKWLCLLLVGVPALLYIDKKIHSKNIHFSPSNILLDIPSTCQTPAPPPAELSQPFHYFGKGSQSYVFLSADGRYVLKFFKRYVYQPESFLAYLPLSWNPYFVAFEKAKKKQKATFDACTTAYHHLKEKSGLVYLHLFATQNRCGHVQVIDKRGESFSVDLDRASFQLQRKADLLYPRLTALMHAGDSARAQKVITSLFSLLETLGKMGVYENDPILRKNFGLIDDEAVQIDVGKMKISEERAATNAYQQEIGSITARFQLWLENNFPELLPHFTSELLRVSCPPTPNREPQRIS